MCHPFGSAVPVGYECGLSELTHFSLSVVNYLHHNLRTISKKYFKLLRQQSAVASPWRIIIIAFLRSYCISNRFYRIIAYNAMYTLHCIHPQHYANRQTNLTANQRIRNTTYIQAIV